MVVGVFILFFLFIVGRGLNSFLLVFGEKLHLLSVEWVGLYFKAFFGGDVCLF